MKAFSVEYGRYLFLENLSMLISNFLSAKLKFYVFLVKYEKQNGRRFIMRMYTVFKKHLNFGHNFCKMYTNFKNCIAHPVLDINDMILFSRISSAFTFFVCVGHCVMFLQHSVYQKYCNCVGLASRHPPAYIAKFSILLIIFLTFNCLKVFVI